MLSVLIAFGSVVGLSEGIQASQRKARREEHRSRKQNLVVHCPKSSAFAAQLEGRQVVLSGNRVYVDTNASEDPEAPFGHPFAGYYLPYPGARYAGLVSTITDVAPIMNWVYVDASTHELCYGNRAASEGNYTGPWDCTRQDRRMTFAGWEGFVAVRFPFDPETGGGGVWALFFDKDADRLKSKLQHCPQGTVAVEVELARRELRTPAPPTPEQIAEMKKQAEEDEAARIKAAEEAQKAAEEAQRAAEEAQKEAVRVKEAEEEAARAKAAEVEQDRQKGKQLEGRPDEPAAVTVPVPVPLPETRKPEMTVKERRQQRQREREEERRRAEQQQRSTTPDSEALRAADRAADRARLEESAFYMQDSQSDTQDSQSLDSQSAQDSQSVQDSQDSQTDRSSVRSSMQSSGDGDDGYSSSVYSSSYLDSPRESASSTSPDKGRFDD